MGSEGARELVGTVGVWDSSCLQLSVLNPESKKEGYGKQSGARDS